MESRHILHIDMNAFYCACHAAVDPASYAGRPTAVAGSPETRHGVVVTASYEARARGVRATMTVAQALQACPQLVLIRPDFDLYRDMSRRVFSVVRNYTPQLEIFSIDECWADVTGSGQFGSPRHIADLIQARLHAELGLPCSIGIAPNKFLAKMASDFKKPMGITTITAEDVPTQLWPLPVIQLFGVGKRTAERLDRLGIRTVEALARADVVKLHRLFGKWAIDMVRHANGQDDAPVISLREPPKSVGHSITLAEDLSDLRQLSAALLNLADQVGRRVRRHLLTGRTITITIRYADRTTITRAHTLDEPTDLTEDIYTVARDLLYTHKTAQLRVRLIGVSLSQLQDRNAPSVRARQLTLFSDDGLMPMTTHKPHQSPPTDGVMRTPVGATREKLRKLTEVTDKLRDKYGEDIVLRGPMLREHESKQIRDRKARGTSLQKDTLE